MNSGTTTSAPLSVTRVEDTARWVAMARALESERKDRHFDDRFARSLAGEGAERLVAELSGGTGGIWPIVARTVILDRLVIDAIGDGVDVVVNLAAGLDARPYRLALPAELTWIEVDHAELIDAKTHSLRDESPRCVVERVALDLSDLAARAAFFARVRARFSRMLVITEGLLLYLPHAAALGLARELLAMRPTRWLTDLNNVAVNRFIAERTRGALAGTAVMTFGVDDGTRVFEEMGWKTVSVHSTFKTAGALKRLPFPMSFFARLPEKRFGTPGRPWTGVCALEPDASVAR